MAMEVTLGMMQEEAGQTGDRGGDEGKKLKSITGWLDGNNGTNLSGFNGKPSGRRYDSGTYTFSGKWGYWWSSSMNQVETLWARRLNYENDQIGRYEGGYFLEEGLSVRCIKD